MSDHDELADKRDAEAAELERHGELVGDTADEARKALQSVKDDPMLPTPLEEVEEVPDDAA